MEQNLTSIEYKIQAVAGRIRELREISGLSVEEMAAAIADYVRQSASYDLMTDRMPADQTDFAIWFLEEGTTGYCVHFATAATMLLLSRPLLFKLDRLIMKYGMMEGEDGI